MMTKSPILASFPALLAAGILVLAQQESFSPLRGPYMGLEAPDEPEIFLPGKISTGFNEGCSLFYSGARAFLWRTNRTGEDGLSLLEDRDGRWQPPRQVQLFEEGSVVWDFNLSPDGEWLYFTSDKPVSGMNGSNLWRARLESGEWRRPEVLGPEVNSDWNDCYPSLTRAGDLYFFRRAAEDPSDCSLYSAAAANGSFRAAEKLDSPINTSHSDYDPFVAGDGSYLIFSSRSPGGYGQGDLYISFRDARGGWGEPVNLGRGVNTEAEENRPSVTLDGKYFFFTSDRHNQPKLPPGIPPARSMPGNGSRDIYWMKADFIEDLRAKQSAADLGLGFRVSRRVSADPAD